MIKRIKWRLKIGDERWGENDDGEDAWLNDIKYCTERN